MTSTLSPTEESQLAQTIEMFEVITQSQPNDFQSLEILKEAYAKVGRDKEVINTSKRIAQAYVHMGQLSSAILEYETILQLHPDDPDVQAALKQIEARASSFPFDAGPSETTITRRSPSDASARSTGPAGKSPIVEMDDGRKAAFRIFVESKVIAAGDFDLCWSTPDPGIPSTHVNTPFIQLLAEKGIIPIEQSLQLIADKVRVPFLPLSSYDVDLDLARSFPAALCRRWCILPFDRISKSVLVATANPFNQQAIKELSAATSNRLLWYLVPPADLIKYVRKAFR
jgi:tetratricopeptide (TPR) repeat protein